MPRRNAQASTEFLLILAAALVILGAVFVLSQQQTVDLFEANAQTQTRAAVDDLAAAARDVYVQGEGARKQVFIQLPSSYNAGQSFIANQSIKLRASGGDYVASNDFDMHGTLPAAPGNYWVWVISEGNRVRIALGMFQLSRGSINLVMERNDSVVERFTITNTFDDTIQVNLTAAWSSTDVDLALSDTTVTLDTDESAEIVATFVSDTDALGFYTGTITLVGTGGSETEAQSLPITVEVIVPSDDPPLTVTPNLWEVNVTAGQSIVRVFTVCTNMQTTVPSVTFAPSPGNPGSWVTNTGALGSLGPGECAQKTLGMSVPVTANGTYTGYVVVSGGTSEAEDYILLNINVVSADGQIPPPILFVHINNNPTGNEERWLDWLNAHSSGEGLDWTYNITEDDDVYNNVVSLTDYDVVIMSEYNLFTPLAPVLLDFVNQGGHVIFLGDSILFGPLDIGYTSFVGYSMVDEDAVDIFDNTHYITTGFPIGGVNGIYTTNKPIYSVFEDYGGGLAYPVWHSGSFTNRYALAVRDNVIVWGASRPDKFNSNGDLLTTRVIDCALLGCADAVGE